MCVCVKGNRVVSVIVPLQYSARISPRELVRIRSIPRSRAIKRSTHDDGVQISNAKKSCQICRLAVRLCMGYIIGKLFDVWELESYTPLAI